MQNISNYLPLVTIVIPTYNNASYISDAVKSAIAQDYPNMEIIIIDDASVDNTTEIVNEYLSDKRISYYKNEYNIGRVATYHKGLYKLAKGEWYLNLDGDDYLTDNSFISKAIEWVKEYNNIVMVVGNCERIVDSNLHYTIRSKYFQKVSCIEGPRFFLDLPSEKSNFIHLATLYNRIAAIKLNFYNEDILSTDFESLYRLVLTGNIIVYDSLVGVWRIHGRNESSLRTFSLYDIIQNFKFIENASLFARSYLNHKEIKQWRSESLLKVLESYIVRVIMHKPKNSFRILTSLLFKYPDYFIWSCFRIIYRRIRKIIPFKD